MLYLSVVTVAALRFGIAAMPVGKRRNVLHERVYGELLPVFAGRVLPFDLDASRAYAALMMKAKLAGQAITMADATIAAIAASPGFLVATRDVAPFDAAGVPVINPWARRSDTGQLRAHHGQRGLVASCLKRSFSRRKIQDLYITGRGAALGKYLWCQ